MQEGLFGQALGLERPWYVERTEFDAESRRLDLHLNFEAGGTFACGACGGEGCKAYDTSFKQWRHLNFFQHQAYLHAPSPRVDCPKCGIRQAQLPWARPRSGFTLLFEALLMMMAAEMPVRAEDAVRAQRATIKAVKPETIPGAWRPDQSLRMLRTLAIRLASSAEPGYLVESMDIRRGLRWSPIPIPTCAM